MAISQGICSLILSPAEEITTSGELQPSRRRAA